MKKVIRYLVIAVVVVIALLVASIAVFAVFFDANAYKDDLSELVREQTGRELRFDGDVSLTVFPSLGMKLGAMTFSNPDEFGALPMIRVEQASISVDLLSLLSLAPEIDKLVLRDLEINLIKNKIGVNNWDDLLQAGAAPDGTAAAGPDEGSEPAAASSDRDFEIRGAFGGLDLQNIRLLWLDEQNSEQYRVNDLDISTGRITPDEPFDLSLQLDASASGDLQVLVDLKTRVEYLIDQQRLSLSDILLSLNEFQLSGNLQLSDFAKPTPTLGFDLLSQNIDVDELLGTAPADAAAPEPAIESGDTAAADAADEDLKIALPMQTLRDLDIDGRLRITQIKAMNLKMDAVDITVKAQNGLVGLKPLRLNTYGGKVEASVVVDVNSKIPKYGVSKSIEAVQIGDLLRDFSGSETISGNLNASANLTTSGEWLSELKQRSNGSLNLAFLDGALNGFNIRQSIDAAKAKLRGQEAPSSDTLKTDFSSLKISGQIRNGVFSSDDLDLQAPLLRVGGKGQADLNAERVDYLVNAKLVGSVEGQQGDAADELAGLAIPVRIKGPFSGPEIDVQLDEMLKAKVDAKKEALKAEIEQQKAALKKQLEAEKKALAESKKRELEKKREIEKAKAKAKLKKEKDKARKKLEDKLKKALE